MSSRRLSSTLRATPPWPARGSASSTASFARRGRGRLRSPSSSATRCSCTPNKNAAAHHQRGGILFSHSHPLVFAREIYERYEKRKRRGSERLKLKPAEKRKVLIDGPPHICLRNRKAERRH